MKIAVVGAGYVGLVSGLVHWERGHDVAFVEIDDARREGLMRGVVPFREPGVEELLARANASGRVRFVADFDAILGVCAAFVCVPTPVDDTGRTDTRALVFVAGELARVARRSDSFVGIFVRSSCVPGTTRSVFGAALRDVPAGAFGVLPEFLREGSALEDQRRPDRLIVGTESERLRDLARSLYAGVDAALVETTVETAELVKLANNAWLSTCISLANEIASIAEHVPGVDADVVFAGVHLDRRLGGPGRAAIVDYLKPGAGFGGSCLGKDLRALATFAREHAEPPRMLDAVHAVNDAQPIRLVARLEATAEGLAGKRVLVLGLAFKPGTDDVRGTVALPIVAKLASLGASVIIHDPLAARKFLRAMPDGDRDSVVSVDDWRAVLPDVAAVLLVTAWPEYAKDLPTALAGCERPVVVADGRSVLRGARLPALVRYVGVGLGPASQHDPETVAPDVPRSE